jgi:hypothetical protein
MASIKLPAAFVGIFDAVALADCAQRSLNDIEQFRPLHLDILVRASRPRLPMIQLRQMAASVIKIIHVIFGAVTAVGFDDGFALGFGGCDAWHGGLRCSVKAERIASVPKNARNLFHWINVLFCGN